MEPPQLFTGLKLTNMKLSTRTEGQVKIDCCSAQPVKTVKVLKKEELEESMLSNTFTTPSIGLFKHTDF